MWSKLSYYFEMFCKLHWLRSPPKIFNYLKFRSMKRKAVTSVKRYTPQICTILVTKRCNLDCVYCSVGKILEEKRGNTPDGDAKLEQIKRIFTNPIFANCLLVDLSGGEPLLVNDLEDMVSYLAKRGHITNLITNGLLLSKRIESLKLAGIARINISMYDANWPVLKRDLANINKIFPVHLSMVLTRSMLDKEQDDIFEKIRFVKNAGCRSLRFWIYRPVGVKPQIEEIISDTLPAYIQFRRRVEETWPNFCLWPAPMKKWPVKKLCPQLWQRTSSDLEGNMMICCGVDTPLQGQNSNLFSTDPEVLFNHPMVVAMREKLLDPDCEPAEICKNCNLLGEPGW